MTTTPSPNGEPRSDAVSEREIREWREFYANAISSGGMKRAEITEWLDRGVAIMRRAASPAIAPAEEAGLRRAFNRLLRESKWVREAYELDKDNSLIATDFCAAVKAAEALAADPNARTTP